MGTIVVYTKRRPPLNAYPKRIISPPKSSRCCSSHMEEVGGINMENGWRFFYKRCGVCGFTVRHFLPYSVERLVWSQREERQLKLDACA